jgi:hypothetical protein
LEAFGFHCETTTVSNCILNTPTTPHMGQMTPECHENRFKDLQKDREFSFTTVLFMIDMAYW